MEFPEHYFKISSSFNEKKLDNLFKKHESLKEN